MNQTMGTEPKPATVLAAEVLRTNRRGVLCGALGASAVAVLAACSTVGPEDTGDKADDSTGKDKTDADESLAKVSDIPVGGGITAAGLVLVQPEEGTIVAFDGACPHKGTQLPAPEDGTITCPSHGSRFAAADGALSHGPASTGLTEVKVTVTDGEVFKA